MKNLRFRKVKEFAEGIELVHVKPRLQILQSDSQACNSITLRQNHPYCIKTAKYSAWYTSGA